MSDNAVLATTGGGTIVIGTVAVQGWELLAFALGLVLFGAVAIRVGFRRKRAYNQK